jgi:hypothetical protein
LARKPAPKTCATPPVPMMPMRMQTKAGVC